MIRCNMHVCVYVCERERERHKVIISAGKTSVGQEMALARAADGRERAVLARPGRRRAFQRVVGPVVLC